MPARPTAPKIMVIRHAEKPPAPVSAAIGGDSAEEKDRPQGPPFGIDSDGTQDNESLTVQGWQRAGALACLFAPTHGPLQDAGLAAPQFLFASDSKSRRPMETIAPLGSKLGLQPAAAKKGDFNKIVDKAMSCGGVALICWQHEDIPAMANRILGDTTTAPQEWPGSRFDVVWIFDLDAATGTYSFSQVPQQLLEGDLPGPIKGGGQGESP